MKRRLAYLLLMVFSVACAAGGGNPEHELRILYTASLNGNLDGCYCVSHPRAGLVTRAHILRSLPDRDKGLLVDVGDILDVGRDELLAEAILETYNELDYDAVAVGDQEFSNGLEMLLEYRERYPLVSHNLALCPTEDSCIFFSVKPILVERAGLKIGLFAVSDEESYRFSPIGVKDRIKISSATVTAEGMVSRFREQGIDLTVVLFHGYVENARKLAEEVSGIDVIVVGHEQRLVDAERVGSTVLVSPGEEGNRLGTLTVNILRDGTKRYANTFRLFDYTTDQRDARVQERVYDYRVKMRARLEGENTRSSAGAGSDSE